MLPQYSPELDRGQEKINMEKTFVIIKPDGVERNLIGEIIKRYEEAGLKITSMDMTTVSPEIISKHYVENEDYLRSIGEKAKNAGAQVDNIIEYGRGIVIGLKKYLSRGPIVKMIIEGDDAVSQVRKITGFTDPTLADKGTIRGDLGTDSIKKANEEGRPTENLIHASGNLEEANSEIELWFN